MHRLMTAAALLLSLMAPASALDAKLLQARLNDLNAWLRLHTDYRATHLPKVVFRTEEEMARLHFGQDFRPDLIGWVRAQTSSGVMFLPPDIKLDGSEDYVLLHELVHFQQFEAGKGEECSGYREQEAYELQDRFVASTGRGKTSDPLSVIVMVAACSGY